MKTKSKQKLIGYAVAAAGVAGLIFVLLPNSEKQGPQGKTPHATPRAESATAAASQTGASKPQQVSSVVADANDELRASLKARLLELAAKEKDPLEYEGALIMMFRGYNREQLKALLEIAQDGSLDPVLAAAVRVATLGRWFEINPAESVKLADSGLLGNQTGSWLQEKLKQWAQNSPATAFDYLQANPLSALNGELTYHALARGAAWGGSPEWVDRALARVTDPQQRLSAVASASQYLQQYHSGLVDDWIKGLPPAEQPRALAEAAKLQVKQDVPGALQKLGEIWNSNIDTTSLFGTTGSVLARWAEQNPTGAADWLVEQKMEKFSGAQREMLMATLLRVWARKDSSEDGFIAWRDKQMKAGRLDEAFLSRAFERF